jgi:hypothetical protein
MIARAKDISKADRYYYRLVPSSSESRTPPLEILFERAHALWITDRPLVVALGAATLLVLARSAVFLWWEQAGFDSDQAIFGLMAKHLAELRSFPMFIYGAQYMLAVQAWLAAPLFAIFGPSVAALKVPVLLVNVATAGLLVWILHRDGGLTPAYALAASLFYVFAPPALAASLVETGGGNPEPFFYVLLLWVLRARPLAFGIVFALGFMQREFTLYGLTAIVVISLLDDWRVGAARLRAAALAAIGYAIVWQMVRTGFAFSSPFGPGSAIQAQLGTVENIVGLVGRACFSPARAVPSLVELFGGFLAISFGADTHRLSEFGIRSALRSGVPGLPGFWPLLGSIFAFAMARVVWLSLKNRTPLWRGRAAAGAFVLLVGLQAAVGYAVSRCGGLDVGTFRYTLLSLYTGVGVVALFFIFETNRILRAAMTAVVIAWGLTSATVHGRLLAEYVYNEPENPRRELATYLVTNGIRYAQSDYWTAYSTTFLANERAVVASTEVIRISGYQTDFATHRQEAVTIQTKACERSKGAEAVRGMYWVCPESD